LLVIAVLGCGALSAPTGAAAATVVNGDFETGTLNGWSVHRVTESGNWFAYKADRDPKKPPIGDPIAKERNRLFPPKPPEGNFAAIADELRPDTLILSQDVALEPGTTHWLGLVAYYESQVPIAVPTPNTLSVDDAQLGGQANQQYRIDVMKPGAPIESVDPADILATLLQTRPGDPRSLPPTRLIADLSAFAGQTVRLRAAVAAHEELITAGLDAVSISPRPPGQAGPPPGSGRLRPGKVKLNRKNGTATMKVQVPSRGRLTASAEKPGGAGASKAKKGKPRQLIKPVSREVAAAGTVTIPLKPTAPARKVLKQKHKLRIKVALTFAAAGEAKQTATVPVVLRLEPRPRHQR